MRQIIIWGTIALVGTLGIAMLALSRGESINALWLIVTALCVYALAYRFYSAFIVAKALSVDATRATPAERLNNGLDFMPTNKWVVFGHHFAAIAGPGPLIGPTLAAQFGYLPGTLWILVGSVLGGAVQDMLILFFSMRRNARSLGQMARDEIGLVGGTAALISTFLIMIILIAVLGLVVVNAMKHSAWATATVSATIPIALFVGIYLRYLRPAQILEASIIGIALLLLSVLAGGWLDHQPTLRVWFDQPGLPLAWAIMLYGFCAAVLPVWLLLAPRDYLSTFMKLGTVILLALAIVILHPSLHMPAVTTFVDGTGPIFGGKLFPFLFITIACGAISGFHSLVASGTTSKLLANERDIRMIGYGSMLLESFVAIMAIVAASVLDPAVFFAINSPVSVIGTSLSSASAKIQQLGFNLDPAAFAKLAQDMGESTLLSRTGGAPSLAVGMAHIFSGLFGKAFLAVWYHFAIMFEAIFILTTLDAGTRVGRFMLQDMLGNVIPKLGQTSWWPSVLLTSAIVVAGWGYFLYIGVIDPNGGVNILWPLFGMANQMLSAIALCVATTILVKSGKQRYVWVSGIPLLWLVTVTSTTAWHKVFSHDVRVGFFAAAEDLAHKLSSGILPPDKVAVAPQLIFNQQLDAYITIFFVLMLWLVVADTLYKVWQAWQGRMVLPSSETPYVASGLI